MLISQTLRGNWLVSKIKEEIVNYSKHKGENVFSLILINCHTLNVLYPYFFLKLPYPRRVVLLFIFQKLPYPLPISVLVSMQLRQKQKHKCRILSLKPNLASTSVRWLHGVAYNVKKIKTLIPLVLTLPMP